MRIEQLVIIGSGPAGYTAAIYAARAGLKPVLFKGLQPGGQLSITTDVENYPGFPQGILGPEMMVLFEKQAKRFGTDIRDGRVDGVNFSHAPFHLTLDNKEQLQAKSVIISTGAAAKWLGIPGEERLGGKGVSACAVCDGFFFKGKVVALVGGGDTACEEAIYLAKLCQQVHMLVRKDNMRASTIMQKRVAQTTNIDVQYNYQPMEVLGTDKVQAIRVAHTQTHEEKELPVAALFVAIGHTPNTDIFKGQLDMNEQGYIHTQAGTSKTNIPGVFATGDVQDNVYRQAITAAGSGCMGALDAERYLANV